MAERPEPCQLCHSPVQLRQVRMRDMPLNQTGPSYELMRRCTNPGCPSNQRDRSLADVP